MEQQIVTDKEIEYLTSDELRTLIKKRKFKLRKDGVDE